MTSCVGPPLIAGRHPTNQADTSTVGPRHPPVERLGGQRSPRTTVGREQQSSPFDAAAAGEPLAPSTADAKHCPRCQAPAPPCRRSASRIVTHQ